LGEGMVRLICVLLFVSTGAFASLPMNVSMLRVVSESDHVLTVDIVGVDMIDGEGKKITDPESRTGPGNDNVIRLICNVVKIHASTMEVVPETILIPLDGSMHYALGQVQETYKGGAHPFVAVLKGPDLQPPFRGLFGYPIYELETVMALYSLKERERE